MRSTSTKTILLVTENLHISQVKRRFSESLLVSVNFDLESSDFSQADQARSLAA
jgi:hypothetical protein